MHVWMQRNAHPMKRVFRPHLTEKKAHSVSEKAPERAEAREVYGHPCPISRKKVYVLSLRRHKGARKLFGSVCKLFERAHAQRAGGILAYRSVGVAPILFFNSSM